MDEKQLGLNSLKINDQQNGKDYYANLKFIIGLFVVSVLFSYFSPTPVKYAFFTGLLLYAYKSNNSPVMLAFFVLLFFPPGYLLNSNDLVGGLPKFSLFGLRDVTFHEIFIIVVLFKALAIKGKPKIIVPNALIVYFFTTLLILVFSIIVEIDLIQMLKSLRYILPITLFFSLSYLFSSKGAIHDFFRYILPFSAIILLSQLFMVLTGLHLSQLFGGNFGVLSAAIDVQENLARPNYATHLLTLNIAVGFYLQSLRKNSQSRILRAPWIFSMISIIAIFFTATRGYALGAVVIVFIYAIIGKRVKISKLLLSLAILFIILISISLLSNQITHSLERLLTVFYLFDGDLSAGGTLRRLTDYLPEMLEIFYRSPLWGYGFTSTFFENSNAHVAFANILLQSGLIGFLIINAIYISLILKSISWYLEFKDSFYLLSFAVLTALFLIHSTSYAVFSYLLGQGNYFILLIVISFMFYRNRKYTHDPSKN